MLRRSVCFHLFTVLVFTLSMPSAWAADADADDLTLYVVPYLWLVGIEGNTTVRGRDASVDVSFQDVLEHLDAGFMMDFEAWMLKRFGLLLNWVSADLGASAQGGPRRDIFDGARASPAILGYTAPSSSMAGGVCHFDFGTTTAPSGWDLKCGDMICTPNSLNIS